MSDTDQPEDAIVEEIATDEAAAPAPKGKRLLKIIAGIVAVAALGGGGYVAFQHFGHSSSEAEAPEVAYVEVPDMLVNMRTADGHPRFLKVKLVLEIADDAAAPRIEKKLPLVVDGFQSFLRETRPEDLAGSSGTFRIKEELLSRAVAAAKPDRVSDVLIQELVQQ